MARSCGADPMGTNRIIETLINKQIYILFGAPLIYFSGYWKLIIS